MTTFPLSLLQDGCVLCERIKSASLDSTYLGNLSECLVFESPFASRWPGSLMLVYERHKEEITDLIANGRLPIFNALTLAEKAVRSVCNPRRMNVVKFGNVCSHLHWHLIPRYNGEICAEKTPWELSSLSDDEVFSPSLQQNFLQIAAVDIRKKLQARLVASDSLDGRFFYSAAVLVRPRDVHRRIALAASSLNKIVAEFRENPTDWETLLMQRNYDDGAWDHFGGCADGAEFPRETLVRELFEEAGWSSREELEFARHWRGSTLRGFCFVVLPSNMSVFVDDTSPCVSPEVAKVSWFSIGDIFTDERFAGVVRHRMRALACGSSDFDCDDVFVPHRIV